MTVTVLLITNFWNIAVEIGVYGRNREHLVLLADGQLRRDVRDFFTRVAALLAQVRWRLSQFYEARRIAETETDPQRRMQADQLANDLLREAHQACDRLRELRGRRETLEARLDKISSRLLLGR